jgi:enterochelin esterase family protein
MQPLRSPEISGNDVAFCYPWPARSVYLFGDMNDWREEAAPLQWDSARGAFTLHRRYERDARFDYVFLVDGRWQLDPLNPHTSVSYFRRPHSCFAMPDYSVEYTGLSVRRPLAGSLQRFTMRSAALEELRRVAVYLPPLAGARQAVPVLYVHDGEDYIQIAELHRMVDTMIVKGLLPPLAVAFLDPVDRYREYDANPRYERFVVEEDVPRVEGMLAGAGMACARRGTLGASLGGFIGLKLALDHPGLFDAWVGQSSALALGGRQRLVERVEREGAGRLSCEMLIGTYDDPAFLEANRRLAKALERGRPAASGAGAPSHRRYREFHEGHSWGLWRARLPEMLRALFASDAYLHTGKS